MSFWQKLTKRPIVARFVVHWDLIIFVTVGTYHISGQTEGKQGPRRGSPNSCLLKQGTPPFETETFANSLPEQSVVSPIRSPLLLSLLSSRNYYALKWGRIGYYLNLQRPRYRNRGRPITESRAAPFQGLVLVLVMNPAALF